MRERGILFKGELVRAILAGTKTQTRRLITPQPASGVRYSPGGGAVENGHGRRIVPRHGVPGDRLYVRETWAETDSEGGPVIAYKAGGYLIHGATGERRDGTWKDVTFPGEAGVVSAPERWRPAIHMPRWASRITLEITDVRVQRLQEISGSAAVAEGMTPFFTRFPNIGRDQRLTTGELAADDEYRASFAVSWDEINGDRATWLSNPYVWAISFRRIDA